MRCGHSSSYPHQSTAACVCSDEMQLFKARGKGLILNARKANFEKEVLHMYLNYLKRFKSWRPVLWDGAKPLYCCFKDEMEMNMSTHHAHRQILKQKFWWSIEEELLSMRCSEIQDWMISPIDQNKPSTIEKFHQARQNLKFHNYQIQEFDASSRIHQLRFFKTHTNHQIASNVNTKTPQKLEMKTTHTSQDSSGAGINGGFTSFTTVISTRPIKQKGSRIT